MQNQLTKALSVSFAIIHKVEALAPSRPFLSMSDIRQDIEESENVAIDSASPMAIWQHFKNDDGTGQRTMFAYDKNDDLWGFPIVTAREAIPNLVKYFTEEATQ